METRHIRYFIAVAEELHFRRAAERLNLAQPSLSRAVQQLENSVGVRLLNRTNRRVELTVAGEVFLKGCRRAVESLETAAHLARKSEAGEVGHLTIGYTDFAISGVLPQILGRFRRELPGITVELSHMFTEPQIEALAQGTIDFGFMTGPVLANDLSHVVVQKDRFVVILPENHRLAGREAVPLAELRDEPFVAGAVRWWSFYQRHMEALCQSAGFRPKIVQEAFNSESIFGFVAANIGVTIHPECARNYIRKGIVIKDLESEERVLPTEVAWVTGAETPVMQVFIRFLDRLETILQTQDCEKSVDDNGR